MEFRSTGRCAHRISIRGSCTRPLRRRTGRTRAASHDVGKHRAAQTAFRASRAPPRAVPRAASRGRVCGQRVGWSEARDTNNPTASRDQVRWQSVHEWCSSALHIVVHVATGEQHSEIVEPVSEDENSREAAQVIAYGNLAIVQHIHSADPFL